MTESLVFGLSTQSFFIALAAVVVIAAIVGWGFLLLQAEREKAFRAGRFSGFKEAETLAGKSPFQPQADPVPAEAVVDSAPIPVLEVSPEAPRRIAKKTLKGIRTKPLRRHPAYARKKKK